jgi:ABC-type branched-subunit amino acid transport system ATPase component/branched-subunit amino acid ABC-type transport system permease component
MEAVRFAILGLGVSGIYGLIGLAIVTVHRGAGVLNFAAAAIGMVAAFLANDLSTNHGVPFLIAFFIAVVLAAAIGVLFHFAVMRRVEEAPDIIKIIGTLGLMLLLIGLAEVIFVPQGQVLAMPSFLPTDKVDLFSDVTVGADRLILFGIGLAVTLGLALFHQRTRFGLATSAVAENRVVAAATGWSPDVIAAITWALGSAVAAVGMILIAPIAGLNPTTMALLVVPAMAAALFGGFDSWWLTLLGATLIGVGQSEAGYYLANPAWPTVLPLVLVVVILTLRGVTLPSKAAIAQRLPTVGPGRIGVGAIGGVVAGVVLAMMVNVNGIDAVSLTFQLAIVVLSVVLVTGFAGQLSLAQLELAGMGAFFVAVYTVQLGLPMWLAIILAAISTVPVGLAVGIPALRVRGSHLAIATLALATVIDALVLTNESFASLQTEALPQLSFLGLSFDTIFEPANYALFSLAVLALAMLTVSNLRRGRVGRRLLAVRGNERASAALGISVSSTKLYAFGFGALLAGLGGALIVAQLPFANYANFTITGSIGSLLQGVIGGLGWVGGAPIGATAGQGTVGSEVIGVVVPPGNWLDVLTGVFVLLVILQTPNGVFPFYAGLLERLDPLRKRREARKAERTAKLLEQPDLERAARAPVAVEARDVTVRFGAQAALDGVSLEIRPGEVVGLIGPNGAGKSTLIDVISGFQRPKSGSVLLDGRAVEGTSPAKRARLGVSRSFQSLELFEDMTVLDNIRTASDPCPPQRYAGDLVWPSQPPLSPAATGAIDQFRLGPILDRRPADVDYARRRLIAIARAVALDASVILLDEPAAGLDRKERTELADLIRRLASRAGLGVLVVEHDVELVFSICDRVVALDAGKVVASGPPEAVRRNQKVIDAYLGVAREAPVEAPS